MSDWQPIKTAPKDPGVYLLVACPDGPHRCVAVWHYTKWKPIHSDVEVHPDYWMPLPPHPKRDRSKSA